jgi:hypothetical protein
MLKTVIKRPIMIAAMTLLTVFIYKHSMPVIVRCIVVFYLNDSNSLSNIPNLIGELQILRTNGVLRIDELQKLEMNNYL